MVTGASTADVRRDPDRRAQGRADADAPAQLSSSRCSASGTSCSRSTRWTSSATSQELFDDDRAPTTARSPPQIGLDATSPPSRSRRSPATTSSSRSENTPWYDGPTLMELPRDRRDRRDAAADARRSACRCSGSTARTSTSAASPARSRGGTVRAGDARAASCRRAVEPRSRASSTCDGDLDEAVAGQSVTLTLADEIDISRGDVLRRADDPAGGRPTSSRRRSSGWPRSRCCPGGSYLLQDRRRARSTAPDHPHQAQDQRQHARARSRRRRWSSTRSASATSRSTGRSPSTRTPRTATPAASS